MKNRQATSEWIAKEYIHRFRRNANCSVKDLEDDLLDKFCVQVSRTKCYRAKWKALNMLRGSAQEHYAKLRGYKAELLRVDKEGRFDFLLDEDYTFKGFFIGFSSLRKGFLKYCRPIIGFDRCFLKPFLGGALLCAVAKDGNNQMFPIFWAVVECENEYFWTWFLTIILEELQIIDSLGRTFISNQQKGLINAIKNLAHLTEHRNYARHVYYNWKKEFKGQVLKNMFWSAARSTYEAAYKEAIDHIKAENEAAYNNFLQRDPSKFCKSFICELPKCDAIDNNISETFNDYIVKFRSMTIIDMLEEIRCALILRMHSKLMHASGLTNSITPRIRTKLEEIKYSSRLYTCKPAVGGKFQVNIGEDQFVVDINMHTCTCRAWQITGIPCIHAYFSIHWMNQDSATFMDKYYIVETYIETYKNALEPLNGRKIWPQVDRLPIKAPKFKKIPGRPKKNRKRDITEDLKNPNKLFRQGIQMTCAVCEGVMPESRRVKFISGTKAAAKAASAKATASKGKLVPSYARPTIASSANNRDGRGEGGGRGIGAKNGGRGAAPVGTQESRAI
eukprot:XP_015577109.1 uncharacterized protein LOC107261545 [Ricinus communis]